MNCKKYWSILLSCLLLTGLTACNNNDSAQDNQDIGNMMRVGFSTNEKGEDGNNQRGAMDKYDGSSNRQTVGYGDHGRSDFNYHHHADNERWRTQRSFYENRHGDLVNEINSEVVRVGKVKNARTIVTDDIVIIGVDLEHVQDQKDTVHSIREKVTPYLDGRDLKVITDREDLRRIEELDNRLRTYNNIDQLNQEVEQLLRTVTSPFNEQEIAN